MTQDAAANLTLDRHIVHRLAEISPQSGRDLIVFKKLGVNGNRGRFFARRGPDDSLLGLRLALLFTPSFIAYAVTRDQDLRYEFSRQVVNYDRECEFTLTITLTLAIDDPQRVVEQLEEDPLGRLEKEADHLFVQAAGREGWSSIAKLNVAFARKVLESESVDAHGTRAANLTLLEEFAKRRGFLLRNVEPRVEFSRDFAAKIERERLAAEVGTTTTSSHPATIHIDRVAAVAATLSCEARDKDRLLWAACHLAGELALRAEADTAAVERCREILRQEVEAVLPVHALPSQRQPFENLLRAQPVEGVALGDRR